MKIKIKRFRSVKSTNDIAIKMIKKNIFEPTIIFSEQQTRGRGTMGKKWISLKGNLFVSIFFKLNHIKVNFKQFAILNALLLRDLFSKNLSKDIKVKWPNDLLYNNQKICGILQEVISHKKFKFLIVGIGLNTNTAPKNKSFKSTSLKNIANKAMDNKKILKNIKKGYEILLKEAKKYPFSKLKFKYQ